MSAAVRVRDQHTCSLTAPAPHVGGAVQGPGMLTVLVGNQPAAALGMTSACALGLPNAIVGGSTTVVQRIAFPRKTALALVAVAVIVAAWIAVLKPPSKPEPNLSGVSDPPK